MPLPRGSLPGSQPRAESREPSAHRFATVLVILLAACAGGASGAHAPARQGSRADAGPVAFALIGDMQYSPAQEPDFARVMAALDSARLDFVVHIGDIQGGSQPCTDSLQRARRDEFDRSRHPFVLLFGDNEWTDCHRGGFDPQERLRALRAVFAAGPESLGRRRIRLVRQSDAPWATPYAEHVRWEAGGALFVGLNIVGSNNNAGRNATATRESVRRTAAAVEWLRESFRHVRARGLAGVVIAMQGDPGFRRQRLSTRWLGNVTGFDVLLRELGRLVVEFGKPVVLVHGDTHTFIVDMPLSDSATGRVIPNFTRVEVFGAPDAHWVRGTVDARDPRVFRFEPMLVPGNLVVPRGTPSPR